MENQVVDGGDESSFQKEANSVEIGGVSKHQTPGVLLLHIVLNRSSKWCIVITYGVVIVLRQDDVALWAVLGLVLNIVLSFTLKQILKQERPVSQLCSGPGMPSSHAQSISFAVIFMILSIIGWLGFNGLSAMISGFVVAVGVYFSWLRVLLRYHTTSQVVVGTVVGSTFCVLWFYTCDEAVLKAYKS